MLVTLRTQKVNSDKREQFASGDKAVNTTVFATFQHITSVDNLYTQESTVFNPLRGKRPGAGGGASEETKK